MGSSPHKTLILAQGSPHHLHHQHSSRLAHLAPKIDRALSHLVPNLRGLLQRLKLGKRMLR